MVLFGYNSALKLSALLQGAYKEIFKMVSQVT